ncbi:MAG: hypothetical protein RQ750_04175 [Roseovarius sp.]|nr:hypothetical protein [Roseovarius sp.]
MNVSARQTFAPDVPQKTALSNSFALLLAVLADYVSAEPWDYYSGTQSHDFRVSG